MEAFGGSFPRFKQFRVGFALVTAAKNLGLLFGTQVVGPVGGFLRIENFLFVLVKPVGKTAAFLRRQLQQGGLNLRSESTRLNSSHG